MDVVTEIGGLLALCGIASVRCLMPTFLFCLVCRLGVAYGWKVSALTAFAGQVPDLWLSNGALTVLGVMAALELYANWNDTARSFFDEANWERYTKPVYAFLFALAVGAPEKAAVVVPGVEEPLAQMATAPVVTNLVTVTNVVVQVVTNSVPAGVVQCATTGTWTGAVVTAGLSACGTGVLCAFRRTVGDCIRQLDPDNSLKLQTLACWVEETTWLAVLVLVLLVPVLAILLMAVVGACGWMVLRVLREVEKRGSHVCPACSGLVSNTAVKCPHCQTEQPLPYHAAGFCGLPAGATVDPQDATAVRTHHRSLLSAHRCPICATPLKDKLVCDRCATRIWEQGFSREELVRILDLRMALGVMCGVFASVFPVVGFVLTVAFLNMGVLRIVRFYESRGARAVSRFLFSLFKWSALLVAVIFSSVPFVGALFLVPYICSYLRSRSRFLR